MYNAPLKSNTMNAHTSVSFQSMYYTLIHR